METIVKKFTRYFLLIFLLANALPSLATRQFIILKADEVLLDVHFSYKNSSHIYSWQKVF